MLINALGQSVNNTLELHSLFTERNEKFVYILVKNDQTKHTNCHSL